MGAAVQPTGSELRIDVEQIVDAVRGVSNEDRIQTILDVLAPEGSYLLSDHFNDPGGLEKMIALLAASLI